MMAAEGGRDADSCYGSDGGEALPSDADQLPELRNGVHRRELP